MASWQTRLTVWHVLHLLESAFHSLLKISVYMCLFVSLTKPSEDCCVTPSLPVSLSQGVCSSLTYYACSKTDLWKRKLKLDVETKLFCYSDIFGNLSLFDFYIHTIIIHDITLILHFFFYFYEVILETMHFQTNSPYYSTATNRHMSHISHLNNVVAAHC